MPGTPRPAVDLFADVLAEGLARIDALTDEELDAAMADQLADDEDTEEA